MSNDAATRPASPRARVMAAAPVASPRLRYAGLGSDELTFTGRFWRDWQNLNADVILAHCENWMERIGWIGNFDWAAQGTASEHRTGIDFVDSEIYKLLEAMAWELGRPHDPNLAVRFDALVSRVAAAQQEDGYLNTNFGGPGQSPRYSNLADGHELYCFGHLMQAAVARIRTGHSDLLVHVALRAADHLVEEFGPTGRDAICGHPEIEMALVELGRATGDHRYIELATLFVERRGHGLVAAGDNGSVYYLDDLPVRDATVLRGHAVRALYLSSGAFDVGIENGDDELVAAVTTQVANTDHARTYITGGVGARHDHESIGLDFELPNDRAYAETCAGVASVMLHWRLLLATGDEAHADQVERTLLNNVLASPREDGHAFFYANTLHMREAGTAPDDGTLQVRAESGMRAPWFSVSCCPTNVARTLASASSYFATRDSEGVQLHQYGDYDITTVLDGGTPVSLEVRSAYPYDGTVEIRVRGTRPAAFTLGMRVPAWTRGATIDDQGVTSQVEVGRAEIRRVFLPGETVRLNLPIESRFVWPHPAIDADRGQVAVSRGPLILAMESVDMPDEVAFDELSIDTGISPRLTERGASASFSRTPEPPADASLPYYPYAPTIEQENRLEIDLIPYATWANRGPSQMRVWIPHLPTDSPAPGTGVGDLAREPQRATPHPIKTKMSIAPREETQ